MTFSQFDIARMVRCPAVDDEGFSCMLAPSHSGDHRWGRCEHLDPPAHRCMLPPRHPGTHELFWYDRPAVVGERHFVRYGGTQATATAVAARATRIFARHGWLEESRHFEPTLPWRLRWLNPGGEPYGRLVILFEFRP